MCACVRSVFLTLGLFKMFNPCTIAPLPTCSPVDITCGNGSCVESHKKCDGVEDCVDGIDELGCGKVHRVYVICFVIVNLYTCLFFCLWNKRIISYRYMSCAHMLFVTFTTVVSSIYHVWYMYLSHLPRLCSPLLLFCGEVALIILYAS